MKERACAICNSPLTSRATTREQPYMYTIGGLPRVGLVGITVRRCPECNIDAPVIPKPGQLHDVLARLFLRKSGLLAGEELRFLRKHAGMPAQKFAALLAIRPEHLSRVENGKTDTLGETSDRLARAIVSAAIGSELVKEILLKLAEPNAPLRRPLVKMDKNRWREEVA